MFSDVRAPGKHYSKSLELLVLAFVKWPLFNLNFDSFFLSSSCFRLLAYHDSVVVECISHEVPSFNLPNPLSLWTLQRRFSKQPKSPLGG